MYSAIQTGRRDGMQTLDQNMKELVDAGKITSKAAMVKAVNRDMLKHLLFYRQLLKQQGDLQ
jgi:twitching motility protein PilT